MAFGDVAGGFLKQRQINIQNEQADEQLGLQGGLLALRQNSLEFEKTQASNQTFIALMTQFSEIVKTMRLQGVPADSPVIKRLIEEANRAATTFGRTSLEAQELARSMISLVGAASNTQSAEELSETKGRVEAKGTLSKRDALVEGGADPQAVGEGLGLRDELTPFQKAQKRRNELEQKVKDNPDDKQAQRDLDEINNVIDRFEGLPQAPAIVDQFGRLTLQASKDVLDAARKFFSDRVNQLTGEFNFADDVLERAANKLAAAAEVLLVQNQDLGINSAVLQALDNFDLIDGVLLFNFKKLTPLQQEVVEDGRKFARDLKFEFSDMLTILNQHRIPDTFIDEIRNLFKEAEDKRKEELRIQGITEEQRKFEEENKKLQDLFKLSPL